MKPTIRRRALVGAVALCGLLAAASLPAGPSQAGPGKKIVRTTKIAPGLLFTRIVEKKLPRRTFVLTVDPTKAPTLDVTLATNALPSRRATSEIAKRHGALAAVNGDFTERDVGRPTHPFAQDGHLVQTADQRGPLFALARDERTVFLGRPPLRVTVTDRTTGRTWTLDRWNQGEPVAGELVGYSPLGGSLELPPSYACSTRLLPAGENTLGEDGTTVVRDYVVDVAVCTEEYLPRMGGVVLSAAPATDEATELLAMAPGTPMRLRWSLGWSNVYDAVGGMPILVQDGQVVATTCPSSFCGRNPRTAIGVTARGRILLVVVDGRRPRRWSVGASLGELARIMKDLGAVQALNLDGGGSSTMVVNGQVVNKPSDGSERRISNAVLVLPGPDPGEAEP